MSCSRLVPEGMFIADGLGPADCPRVREIFLRALREYSESCEPPGLIPDCPYSIETHDPGVMGCGEECMDLLGRYNAPRPSQEVRVGPGVWLRRSRRPRARRSQQPLAKSYDARQVYLEDQAYGPPRWRLAALLFGLLEVARTPPSSDSYQASDRRERIDELIGLVEGRGLDFEVHVLPTLRFDVGSAVFANLPRRHKSETPLHHPDHMNIWSSWVDGVLEAAEPSQTTKPHEGRHDPLLPATMKWARTTDASTLLDWTPSNLPPADEASPPPVDKPDAVGRWIVTRFTETYLEGWDISSLGKEWLYLHGQHPPPCSPIEMSVREVPEPELAKEMADRLARQPSERHHHTGDPFPGCARVRRGRSADLFPSLDRAAVRVAHVPTAGHRWWGNTFSPFRHRPQSAGAGTMSPLASNGLLRRRASAESACISAVAFHSRINWVTGE